VLIEQMLIFAMLIMMCFERPKPAESADLSWKPKPGEVQLQEVGPPRNRSRTSARWGVNNSRQRLT